MIDDGYVGIYAVCSMWLFDTAYLAEHGVTCYFMTPVGDVASPTHYLTIVSYPGFAHGRTDELLRILRPYIVFSYQWLTYYQVEGELL